MLILSMENISTSASEIKLIPSKNKKIKIIIILIILFSLLLSFILFLTQKNKLSKINSNSNVNDNNVDTLSSEEISDEVKFGEYSAYIRLKSGKNEVVLTKNGTQKVIDSGSDNALELVNGVDTYKTFGHLKFSPKGTYLIYSVSGWEWHSSVIYDINKNQEINLDLWGADIILTDDEKYFISCTSDGAGPGVSVKIYTTPKFNLKKDFQNTIDNIGIESPLFSTCSYSPEKSELNIVLSNGGINNKEKIIKYNFINDQETVQ